jgi:ParB family chromosome partitioning protein
MAPSMNQAMQVLTSQGTDEWYTPPELVTRARQCLGGIDVDPATCEAAQAWIQASSYYTADDVISGLARPWAGRVWLNPPFSDTPRWVLHWLRAPEVSAGLLLVNSAPGYGWWEHLWREVPVLMLRERIRFVRADGSASGQAKKGQTIAYRGPDLHRFMAAFGDLGRVITP